MNKTSRGDGIPAELFPVLKDAAVYLKDARKTLFFVGDEYYRYGFSLCDCPAVFNEKENPFAKKNARQIYKRPIDSSQSLGCHLLMVDTV